MNLRMYVYRGQIDSPLTWPNNRIKDSRSDNKINNLGLNFFFCKIASCVRIAKPAGARTVNVTILILITKFSIFLST
jgi:hypothetical protein